MAGIQLLNPATIDKIAAGEVIERPSSIVKELIENAIDAGSKEITAEIKDGGISLIRVTDNGTGIPKEEVPLAFMRHSTSKIKSAADLDGISTLGFRGEALSSIAAVSLTELITKTKDSVLGTRYVIEGGIEKSIEDTGAKRGSSFLIRSLFYNTPARRKFLKTPMTEAGHINDLIIRLALSHPEISFEFVSEGQVRLHTSGNGKLMDVIYQLFGRDIAGNVIPVNGQADGMEVTGYIGKPMVSRGNRNYENYFINGRYVKNNIIARAMEDAYKGFSMRHQYPFTVLHFNMDGKDLDVNVHPSKMEIRFSRQQDVYDFALGVLQNTLRMEELIPKVTFPGKPAAGKINEPATQETKDNKAAGRVNHNAGNPMDLDYFMRKMKERVTAYHGMADRQDTVPGYVSEVPGYGGINHPAPEIAEDGQLSLFSERFISDETKNSHKIIGQLFGTYWLVEFHDNLYIIDQHAAHERVLYERTLRGLKNREYTSQSLHPPIILHLTMNEGRILNDYLNVFTKMGFEIEDFGGCAFAVRKVPDNLFGIAKKELICEMLDNLSEEINPAAAPDLIEEKIASMSCKAAVKGNTRMSEKEADALIGELLSLDNPYNCPHGRPTIIAMTKRDLEKKFKRIT